MRSLTTFNEKLYHSLFTKQHLLCEPNMLLLEFLPMSANDLISGSFDLSCRFSCWWRCLRRSASFTLALMSTVRTPELTIFSKTKSEIHFQQFICIHSFIFNKRRKLTRNLVKTCAFEIEQYCSRKNTTSQFEQRMQRYGRHVRLRPPVAALFDVLLKLNPSLN